MRLLVLGGTVFVGRAVAAEALRRGHEVVCAARGESGSVPEGARLIKVDRDDPAGLADLPPVDAVVDVAPLSFPWVQRALAALADRVAHWTFVSTISVYADTATPGQTPATGAVLAPLPRHATRADLAGEGGTELYGGIKVAAENAVRAALGDRAFVVRPGLITGPGDGSDRFGYWPARFTRGGRSGSGGSGGSDGSGGRDGRGGPVLVPTGERLAQYIDVRDLAAWIVTAFETGLSGTFDAIGPAVGLGKLLTDIASAVGAEAEFVTATDEQLEAAGVAPWSGPRSLPLWLPPSHAGLAAHDPAPSLAAGLEVRPLADAVAGALEQERALGLDRERRSGLSVGEEAEVLAGL
ncbi:NAD-dependent epimerase/dehydratase family protein [Amycolatopsis rhabdoformis]|uniref:NAD-dependent epimerase/dehydratase family protein n=1 Tax=Amycolatopsis rhabdoformis TaxID=1448059 RepID=A0ABZ1IB51_9PSEU|nr:NAD-dependent epimerase/dehydratase family protein [Amycolatopsis rhabdoformis]WSE31694.1 NAD-dependent epimerase/dehydratase family protein [Amycolatopsis rhabdoformis]